LTARDRSETQRVRLRTTCTGSTAPTRTGGVSPRAPVAFAVAAGITAVIALVPAFGGWAPFSWPIGVLLGAAL
jgi:hypothetical protein